jgi:hypothetical protein
MDRASLPAPSQKPAFAEAKGHAPRDKGLHSDRFTNGSTDGSTKDSSDGSFNGIGAALRGAPRGSHDGEIRWKREVPAPSAGARAATGSSGGGFGSGGGSGGGSVAHAESSSARPRRDLSEPHSGDARNGDARGGDARNGDARGGDARNGDARGGDARNGDARNGDARKAEPAKKKVLGGRASARVPLQPATEASRATRADSNDDICEYSSDEGPVRKVGPPVGGLDVKKGKKTQR